MWRDKLSRSSSSGLSLLARTRPHGSDRQSESSLPSPGEGRAQQKSRIARQYCQHLINVRAEPASVAQVDVGTIARMRSGYAVTAGRREIQASASFTLVVYKIPTTRSVVCDARHQLLYFFSVDKSNLVHVRACRLAHTKEDLKAHALNVPSFGSNYDWQSCAFEFGQHR